MEENGRIRVTNKGYEGFFLSNEDIIKSIV